VCTSGGHAVDHGGADVEAVLVPRYDVPAAVDDDPAALALARVEVAPDARLGLPRDDRAHLAGLVPTGADADRLGVDPDGLDQRVGGGADGHGARDRQAALAGGAERRRDEVVRRGVQVRVGPDGRVVLRAAGAWTRLPFPLPRAGMCRAIGVEPTNDTAATSGWSSSASTAGLAPWTAFAGRPRRRPRTHRGGSAETA
jgi:hypothetical protein